MKNKIKEVKEIYIEGNEQQKGKKEKKSVEDNSFKLFADKKKKEIRPLNTRLKKFTKLSVPSIVSFLMMNVQE